MEMASLIAVAVFVIDLTVRIGLSIRVIMQRRSVGVSLAWLSIILIFPFAGAIIYLLIGELRLGSLRAERAAKLHQPYQEWLSELRNRHRIDWSTLSSECEPLARLTSTNIGIPALPGNEIELLDDTTDVFRSLVADIDAAKRSCHLEFYIWNVGGEANTVANALLRAAARGLHCRILVDAVGSGDFLRSNQAKRLRKGGVQIVEALPVGLFRMWFVRFDLRLHRKIVVIDGETAYTGSLNLVDPLYFKQDAGVGQWVDAMARIRGPCVEALSITFLEDWELEAGEGLEKLEATSDVAPQPEVGSAVVQVVPSGPATRKDAVPEILLLAIYAARHEIVMTTPYFVPDELLLTALLSAARRGVRVSIILPKHVDSRLVRLASRAHQGDLIEAGVRLLQFEAGLLHTKSVTIDGELSFFGSLNLDPRSLHLNFEITLLVYNQDFASRLRSLQSSYADQAVSMDLQVLRKRSAMARLAENSVRLLGPLL